MNEQEENKEGNGTEQSGTDKIKENVQDTKNAVKDGANLAKNIASQNYLGAIKDGLNLLKNKKVRMQLLISAFMPVLSIILIAAVVFSIFNAVGEAIEGAINAINEWYTNNYEFGVIHYTDEQLDTIIESIQNLGIDLDDLNLMGDVDYEEDDPDREEKEKEALKKYLVKFLVAQEKLRTLYPGDISIWNPGDWDDINLRPKVNHLGKYTTEYGSVDVYRTFDKDVSKKKQLHYLYYGNLDKDEAGNIKANKSFYENNYSVDPSGNLIFAKKVETKTETVTNGKKETKKEDKYEIETIDYKSIVDQYTTSVQFFIYLTMITQNPEFAAEVADYAADGEIHLVIMDDKVESTTVTKEEYTEHTQTVSLNEEYEETSEAEEETNEVDEEESETAEGEDNDEETSTDVEEYKREETTKEYSKTTTVTKKEDISKLNITYVNTWYAEQEVTYVKNETKTTTNKVENLEDEEKPEDLPLTEPGEVSWKTGYTITTDETANKIEYVESVHQDVVYKTDKFIELLDKKYHIPNRLKWESPADNFISGADWLLELMSMDAKSQKLEKVIKLIVNEYTNSETYEVTNLNNLIDSKITIDSSEEYFQVGGIQTEEEREELQKKIENELINTKVHSKDSAYQNGPFAQWWSIPKNTLEKFQCTWWVYGRSLMYLENINSSITTTELTKLAGNGGQWYDLNVNAKLFNYGSVPKANSIISWKNDSYGHVAYVEGVTSDGIYISHAGSGTSWMGITKIGLDGNIGWSGYTLNGYIYLDEPIK